MDLVNNFFRKHIRTEPHEDQVVFWSFLYFFFLLFSYYILQPIRDEMGLLVGKEYLPSLFRWSLVVMILVNPIFSYLVSNFPRIKFIPYVYHFFLLMLLMFYCGFRFAPQSIQFNLAWGYFLWVSVFNLFAVSIFWGFMADTFSTTQGKRLFGFIGAGGTLGQICGSAFTGSAVHWIGNNNLLLISALCLEICVFCMLKVAAASHEQISSEPAVAQHSSNSTNSMWEGIIAIFKNRYLLGICSFMLLYTFVATFLYFEKQNIVAEALQSREARTAFFSWINFAVGVLTVIIQLFLTGRIIMLLGIGMALAALPLFMGFGFLTLGFLPILAVVGIFEVLRKSLNYAVTRPAREILYTVVNRSEKYKAKSFIDTFVYRSGDALASVVFERLQDTFKLGVTGLAFSAIPFAVLWFTNGLWLGKKQAQLHDKTTDINQTTSQLQSI